MQTHQSKIVHFGLDQERRLWRRAAVDGQAELLGTDWLPFLGDAECADGTSVVVAGNPANADLIVKLHLAKTRGELHCDVFLSRPAEQPGDQLPFLPTQGQQQLTASLGGQRRLASADFATYSLARMFQLCDETGSKPDVKRLKELLSCHPAAPALLYTPTYEWVASAKLVAAVLDPRWHINPAKPGANKRLTSLLGVGPGGLGNMAGRRSENPHVMAKTLLHAWAGSKEEPPADITTPRSLLWRHQRQTGGDAGFLSASRRFVQFFSAVWLDELTPARRYAPRHDSKTGKSSGARLLPAESYAPQLFVPAHFFDTPGEIEEFRQLKQGLRSHCQGGV